MNTEETQTGEGVPPHPMGEGRIIWHATRGDGRSRALVPGWYGVAPLELTVGSRLFCMHA